MGYLYPLAEVNAGCWVLGAGLAEASEAEGAECFQQATSNTATSNIYHFDFRISFLLTKWVSQALPAPTIAPARTSEG